MSANRTETISAVKKLQQAANSLLVIYEAETDEIAASEAGARNSKTDMAHLQTIHDTAAALGANCSMAEAKKPAPVAVRLVESAAFPSTFEFREASVSNPLVKIISPGRGTSGFYGKEMLQRDGPRIFTRGTLMYFNHATPAEEAQRPEGDWNKLAAVTTGDAYWDEAGKDGPALYAPAKVFAKHAAEIAEKAPHTGVSIRASGKRDDKAIGADGKPGVITELTHAESIDLVTKAGRDGKLLLESADSNLTETGGVMDATELQKLQEANRNISKRQAKAEAREAAVTALSGIRISETSKASIVERAVANVPITDAGDFDAATFKTIVEAEIKYAASLMPNGGASVVGMGSPVITDPAILESRRAADEKNRERDLNRSARQMGIKTEEGKRIFREGRGAFDPNYNSLEVTA